MAWETTRDLDGLKQALLELLEESFAWSRMPSAQKEDAAASMASLPPRTLSPGYYRLAQYLLWLEEHSEAHAVTELTSFEADGLCTVRAARKSFEQQHPPCGACGALQDGQYMLKCWSCGTDFKRG